MSLRLRLHWREKYFERPKWPVGGRRGCVPSASRVASVGRTDATNSARVGEREEGAWDDAPNASNYSPLIASYWPHRPLPPNTNYISRHILHFSSGFGSKIFIRWEDRGPAYR
eukprot:Gb_11067 [translate_table: standard]